MTAIEAALITRMKANAALTALVGTRIACPVARQGWALPYVVLYGERSSSREIATGRSVGLAQWEGSIEVHAEGEVAYESVKSITDAIRTVLDGYRGTVNVTDPTTQAVEAVEIRTSILETQSDLQLPPSDGSEQGRVAQVLAFSVGYFETIPTPT